MSATTTRSYTDSRATLRTYRTYREAQLAVDHLSDEGFPVEHVSIVSEGLRLVEDVTGRKGYGKAALEGAGSGAVIGALLGFFLGLFSIVDPLVSGFILAVTWLVFGAIAGALVGVVAHATTRGERDFSSSSRVEAAAYHLVVERSHLDEAERLLGRDEQRAA